jgi:hypothetical protein
VLRAAVRFVKKHGSFRAGPLPLCNKALLAAACAPPVTLSVDRPRCRSYLRVMQDFSFAIAA